MLRTGSRPCSDPSFSIGHGSENMDAHKLLPGDIILAKTSGFAYSFWRKLSCSLYDHAAVVLKNSDTLNIVYPVTKRLPVSHFFRSGKSPMVLRPAWKNERQHTDFICSMEKLEGTHYNSFRGILNITNMVLYYRLGLKIPLKIPEITARRWVCTDVIIIYLDKIMSEFSEINKLNLDLFRFGFTSPNDFIRIAYHRPDLLKKVE